MSDQGLTMLDLTQSAHEEVERLERLIVKDLLTEPSTDKQRLDQGHRVRYMIDQITSVTHKLVDMYQDKDNAIQESGTNVVSSFYERLKEIREYYRRYPSARVLDTTHEYERLLEDEIHIDFSGEEANGRYLDMHELYNDYINSKFGEQIDYAAYLEVFSQLHHIPLEQKITRQYEEYLQKMIEYLVYFVERTEPLRDLDRLFSKVQNVYLAQHQNDDTEQIALMEVKIEALCEILCEKIKQTKENVLRKQGLTNDEIEDEMADEELSDFVSDNEDQQIYNPLKLPMGWDGKPIPFWLYKLHGLGQEFKCEICGDCSYWGRKDFELHFMKSRHQFGMHRLGIPNTKSFNEITSIEEAQQLWERIKEKQEAKKWQADLEEEFEDEEGNVYNKKTYTDLKRQGLI